MAGELWEIAQACYVQPYDAIRLDIYSHEIHVDRIIRGGGLIEVYPSKDVLSHRQPVLRRHPGHHPDVLMRALEMSVEYMSGTDKAAQIEVVQEFIAEAEAEIAKERES